ncbi:MAG: Spy/CpxP family protein refolding chaperone [Candidatus Aminicenantes bacterium]|nr:Spy/CpxP family protein refolding chaperone [Candidatus Aminicenantes bacterium]
MRKKLALAMIVIFIAATGMASAQTGRRPAAGRAWMLSGDMVSPRLLLRSKDEVGLSAEQVKKLSALVDAHEQWAIQFGADMKIQALKLRSAVRSDNIDMKNAEKLIREQAGMRADMQIARLRLQKDVRALLTPEQAAKAANLKKDLPLRARDRMRHRPAQGRGGRF